MSEDEDVSLIFCEKLEESIHEIYKKTKFPHKIIMSDLDRVNFSKATHCHICEQSLGDDSVRDHCHLTGKYRGAAHNECNLKYKVPKVFPTIFHNLSGYDSHLFIKNLGVSEGPIKCIPNNEEKYISFTKTIKVGEFKDKSGKIKPLTRAIRFIDSFKFMSSGLSTLVNNLQESKFKTMKQFFPNKYTHLLRKGVYPYDYMCSIEKLDEKSLPPKDDFFSKLTNSHISTKEYDYAKFIWKEFNCKTMRDYHDLYLRTDVFLLADVFENFRETCHKNYKLDPAQYFTTPGLAWDACLKKTLIKLDLLIDVDMLQMIENGIRGGVSMIPKRYSKANNPYMKNYNKNEPTKFIQYLDANNLYGWAMSKKLPIGNFKWMKDFNDWRNIPCILEVDLEYPKELHELHNDYPLAPESIEINKVRKLVPTLYNKSKYVIHHENLKQYLDLGLKLTKIHRGISFKESAWMKPYIDFNTKLRAESTNDFDRDFFKLMNNSVFCKTMENIRNRVDIRLVTREKDLKKLINKPQFVHRNIFSENLIAVHLRKSKIYYNKPIYLGMSILDLSKTLMYDFHYKHIKDKYNENAELLFTDTDSLMYEIKTEDVYKDMILEKFDTSNYPKDHFLYTDLNKKIIGKFKDEAGGQQITEFVGLRAKLYSFILDEDDIKKAKGIKQSIVKQDIKFQDYKNCLFSGEKFSVIQNTIQSKNHELYTQSMEKIALCPMDDKRNISKDKIHTKALGFIKN